MIISSYETFLAIDAAANKFVPCTRFCLFIISSRDVFRRNFFDRLSPSTANNHNNVFSRLFFVCIIIHSHFAGNLGLFTLYFFFHFWPCIFAWKKVKNQPFTHAARFGLPVIRNTASLKRKSNQ